MILAETPINKEVYLNDKQLDFLEGTQSRKLFMGGRGAGKSTCLGAKNVVRMKYLAAAKVAWVSFSIRHLKNKVVPPAIAFMSQCGFVEHLPGRPGHYVKWKKPPPHWAKPHKAPDDFSNVITFNNGYTIELVTWHMSDTERGSDFDAMDIDEAAWLKQSIFDSVLMPSVRANHLFYEGNPWHHQICFYTSKPRLPKGMWLHNYEKLAVEYPEEYKFVRCTSWDNKAVLGEKIIKHWEKEMHPLEYAIEIMCEDPGELPNGFYNEYNEDKHAYFLAAGQLDVDTTQPLFLSLDFNAGFICGLVAQEAGVEFRLVNELFVKGTKIVNNLLDLFIERYESHENKRVKLYGDRSGRNRRVDSKITLYEQIKTYLEEAGWEVEICAIISYPPHQDRHDIIGQALQERGVAPVIRVNKRECIYLNLTLQTALINIDYTKDKSSETEEGFPQEQSTHLTDAFDYLIYPYFKPLLNKNPYEAGGSLVSFLR